MRIRREKIKRLNTIIQGFDSLIIVEQIEPDLYQTAVGSRLTMAQLKELYEIIIVDDILYTSIVLIGEQR